jgi:hypothetical protein
MLSIDKHCTVFAEESRQYIKWGTQEKNTRKMETLNVYPVLSEAIADEQADVILKGKIIAIEIIGAPDREHNFVVVTEVTEIIKGEYSYISFQFLIHSPALSRLKAGEEIVIKAVKAENGFVVKDPTYN